MKYFVIIAFAFLFVVSVDAQIYVAGDTTGRYVYSLEQSFNNSTLKIDIDCRDTADLSIVSHLGRQYPKDWPRLSLRYSDSVTVAHSMGNGKLDRFREGDTIPLGDDIWTGHLDFIYGEGALGSYGVQKIDTSYLAFRKIDRGDTSYVFVLVTTSSADIFFHKIISECSVYPLQSVLSTGEIAGNNTARIFPNPFSNQLSFSLASNEFTTISLYNILGQQVLQQTFTNYITINTEQLTNGIYIYKLRNNKGLVTSGKIIRH